MSSSTLQMRARGQSPEAKESAKPSDAVVDPTPTSSEKLKKDHGLFRRCSPRTALLVFAISQLLVLLVKSAVTKVVESHSNTSISTPDDDAYDPVTDHCLKLSTELQKCELNYCNPLASKDVSITKNRGFAIRFPDKYIRKFMEIPGSGGASCVMSKKYGFLYVHNLKSGGTTTNFFLKNALCSNKGFPCDEGDDTLELVPCSKGIWVSRAKKYYVFSFVRNPYARLYSGFAMAERMRNETTHPEPIDFRTFALASNNDRYKMSETHTSHYVPQSKLLADKRGCPVLDYVGRIEHYDDDLWRILREIEKRSGLDTLTQAYRERISANGTINVNKSTSYGTMRKSKIREKQLAMGNSTASNVKSEMTAVYSDAKVTKKVYLEFKADFDMFGYASRDIPWE